MRLSWSAFCRFQEEPIAFGRFADRICTWLCGRKKNDFRLSSPEIQLQILGRDPFENIGWSGDDHKVYRESVCGESFQFHLTPNLIIARRKNPGKKGPTHETGCSLLDDSTILPVRVPRREKSSFEWAQASFSRYYLPYASDFFFFLITLFFELSLYIRRHAGLTLQRSLWDR